MIILEDDCLEFRFPDVHAAARCTIGFQRTLRIPDDGRDYPLPPGLGVFPLRHLDDYAARLPETWRRRGGVIAPMHQAEALWIDFASNYPFAVKVATGKICAITGDAWVERLNRDPQDYAVLPDQPWLDGYCVEKGTIRQFVAMPLGQGYTVEEQLTGAAVHGGLQFVAYPMKAERYEALQAEQGEFGDHVVYSATFAEEAPMGLAPGGRMKQDVYDDPYGLDAWDQRHGSRCFVSLLNTTQWMATTGERPPTEPPTAQSYAAGGLPWFEYYGGDLQAVDGSEKLRGLASVARHAEATGQAPLPDNGTFGVPPIVVLGKPRRVRESARDAR
ncbi:hypothetical protein [Candidatus Rariloculus sp.]|uniref:hypothetical protein n=1 Tax=Candidatus Rariloculus sp. TaxID=3101265 RepID=UPI003D0FF70B